jgi:integrase
MPDITRSPYSLYQRMVGNRTVFYVRFWDDELQDYSSGRSTGQTTKAAADRQVKQWLVEGIPAQERKTPKISQQRILTAIQKYLVETEAIKKETICEDAELIKLFYAKVTSEKMAGGETFVDYLYRFWDWNGDYVRDRKERKKSIGLKHVSSCLTHIKLHIEPYFKDTLLCDITTKSLEDFMRSIPRRDDDPKNGYSRRSINGMMKVIKVTLKHAARLDIITKNPAEKIELLADDTRMRGVLTPGELERLFKLQWSDERGKIAAIVAATSGMRLGEVVALQIENLDFERNIIHVLHSYSSKEQRIKETKTGKARVIFTDPYILRMLAFLHAKNPWQSSFIFYGLEPDKPIREETLEKYTERALAEVFCEDVMKSFSSDRFEIAKAIISQNDIKTDEIIAFTKDNLDTMQKTITLDHNYTINGNLLKVIKFSEKRELKLDQVAMKRIVAFCSKAPYVFILSRTDNDNPLGFKNISSEKAKKIFWFFGEIVRKERNISFHGFRHFFNSTIRGTVSDDILRLQTGHADAKMTDQYDHITDDRGEQLRRAVQTKILPFIPKAVGE